MHIFNNVSHRSGDLKEQASFLRDYLAPDHRGGSLWKSVVDLVEAMEYARRELLAIPYAAQDARGYRPNVGSTWLRYVTFTFAPVVPVELEQFLRDAVNRDALIAAFLQSPERWRQQPRSSCRSQGRTGICYPVHRPHGCSRSEPS